MSVLFHLTCVVRTLINLSRYLLFFYFERLGRDRTGKTKTTVGESGISMATSTGHGLYLHFWVSDAIFLRFNGRMNINIW